MNHYYNERMRRLFNPYSFYGLHRIYHKTIIDEYQNAWVVSQSMNDENLRSCELKLIKLDKHELEWFLLQFYANNDLLTHCARHRLFRKIKNGYAPCVLLHLINVFFMSNQKEKIKLVHVHLNELLHAMTEKNRYDIFERYLIQRLKVKTILTVIDLLTGQIDPQHEFWLKLCYWDILCANKGNGGCTYFLKKNADFLLSNIEEVATNVQWQLSKNTQLNSCNILLCLLNWNICKTQTPVTFQNMETPSSSWAALVADTSINLYTSYKVSSILQIVLSTLSEDEIFTAFNEYLDQILTMKSEITEDDFCTGKIEPYHEFMLKLCYCEKLCNESDDEIYKEFLRRNADLFVSQIEKNVHGNKTKTKLISCKVLLCLLNWNIWNLKTTFMRLKIQSSEIHTSSSFQTEPEYTTQKSCTMYKVRHVLQNLLSTLTEDDISTVFNGYIEQMYAMKSEITPDGLSIGETESHHEFQLKLCYWRTICKKNDCEAFKKFIKLCPEGLIPHLEENVQQYEPKTKLYICKRLLCILNWHICTLKKTQLLVQNTEIQVSQSVAIVDDSTTKTIRRILKTVLSTLSEDEIFTAFNEYLDQIITRKSEITEDDFCTGKIEPYHEFMLKLCYYEKLCTQHDDDETYRKFLRRNADFLVSQIEEVVDGNNTKTKLISCKVLLCLVKWDICNQKTVYTTLNKILSQMLTQKDDCQDFMNENALFFVSMVRTVIKRNNIPLLINLCDVLICISYIELHFCEVTGAINKLIRYYMNQVGTNERTLQSILLLGYRFLKYLNDNQKIDTARKKKLGFPKFCRLLKELSINSWKERKALNLLIEAFKDNTNPSHDNQNKYCTNLQDFCTKVQDPIKQTNLCVGKPISFDMSCSIFYQYPLWMRKNSRKQIATCDPSLMYRDSSLTLGKDSFNARDDIPGIILEYFRSSLLHEPLSYARWIGNMLAFIIMVCIVWTSAVHHSSAKLEKYLSLKHHYSMASLYLLWCSGDIEVHPGPRNKQKTLVHDSSIKRTWIQNVCKMLDTKLSDGVQSKYREKQGRISDKEYRELFKDLLKICHEEKVLVPKQYLAEINAWETLEYKLLHKLFIYRCEIETIIASLQDVLTCGGSTKDLTDINVSIITELKTNEIAMFLGQDQRPKDISQMVAHITRHIAGISIKCAHGKDPDTKYDGLWNLPLKDWPKDIVLFDPNNRGKYSEKSKGKELISDQELLDILLTLTEDTIPQKYKDIVDVFKTMRKSIKEKSINEQHKEELCSTFKRITSLEKLDSALRTLWESGIFTEEVHYNLNKWWNIVAVETTDDKHFSQVDIENAGGKERPHIEINISTKSITLAVEPTSPNSSQVIYDIPLKDELVPLKTYQQKVTAKKYSTVSPQPNACPADIQTNLIFIPPEAMTVLNSYFPLEFYPNSQVILESDIKYQHKISSQKTALYSTIKSHQPITSTNQFSQMNHNIAISGQPGPILCTPNQSTTNSDDISSATKDSQNPDFHMQVSPTSDIGSFDSISSVNSESGNEERDQNNTSNGGQDQLTDSDYSSDSSNNCVSKTSLKKRKCIEEDRIEMKKRKIPSLKQDKKQSDSTSHRNIDSSMDNSTTSNKNMELLLDFLDIDLDLFDIDEQTFEVEMNALDNEDKNLQVCDKDRNLMNDETQMSNKNTTDTNVSSDLEIFLQEMICGESEKMIQMKSYLSDV